jgi:hypothetical protein
MKSLEEIIKQYNKVNFIIDFNFYTASLLQIIIVLFFLFNKFNFVIWLSLYTGVHLCHFIVGKIINKELKKLDD